MKIPNSNRTAILTSRRVLQGYFSILLAVVFSISISLPAKAQEEQENLNDQETKERKEVPFNNNEDVHYDIKYKYGIMMIKAATARFKINHSYYEGEPAYKSVLSMRTTSFFDGIFELRDTLTSYASRDPLIPIVHQRIVNEGSTHFKENLYIQWNEYPASQVRIIREKNNRINIDSIIYSNNPGYDMLNLFLFVRTLDYDSISYGDTFRLTNFVGRKKVEILVRHRGQQIVEKNKNLKYKTIKFDVDIVDEVFSESKNAMEIWISDDENRLPIKLKAKLKIGAAEALITSARNLKHPFTAEINLKK